MKLRCVFYDPDVVDEDDRMTERALEACARAGVEVYELAGDEDVVVVQGEEHEVPDDVGPFEFVLRAHGFERGEAIAVGARLEQAPVSAVWVGPRRPRRARTARPRRRGRRSAPLRRRHHRARRKTVNTRRGPSGPSRPARTSCRSCLAMPTRRWLTAGAHARTRSARTAASESRFDGCIAMGPRAKARTARRRRSGTGAGAARPRAGRLDPLARELRADLGAQLLAVGEVHVEVELCAR